MTTKQSTRSPGFGAQTHGSRKGLGGDPANCGVVPRRVAAVPDDKTTQAQITDMENEGQGQQTSGSNDTISAARVPNAE
jgi:hypothetical protein